MFSCLKYTWKKKTLVSSYSIDNNVQSIISTRVTRIKDLMSYYWQKVNFYITYEQYFLRFIRRNTKGFTRRTKIILYSVFVRNCLEFAIVIWNPYKYVQRSFTSHLAFHASGISHKLPYNQRLVEFKMMFISLRKRREILISSIK